MPSLGDSEKGLEIRGRVQRPQEGRSCRLAWEWLRRHRDYQEDYRRLSRRERSSAAAGQFRLKVGALVSLLIHKRPSTSK
ncbi:transcriptional regulator domain-containing protein [Bradyrhizobium sp. USDA 3311]